MCELDRTDHILATRPMAAICFLSWAVLELLPGPVRTHPTWRLGMRRILRSAVCMIALATIVSAQSSGNFSARVNTTKCLIDNVDGSLDGGIGSTVLQTTIKTPNASQTALVIRPSLVSGLFTRTKVDETTTTSTAW